METLIAQKIITVDNLFKVAYDLNFKIWVNKLNIWGIRTPQGEFNDYFLYFWRVGNQWKKILAKGTTEPGQSYLQKKMLNKNGTAILVHNQQYLDCWEVRKHKQQYDALCQIRGYQFKVWRDANQNGVVDYGGDIYTDATGINNHSTRLGYLANWIGDFSAGCQVVWFWAVFAEIMKLVKERNEKTYSYALITDEALKQSINYKKPLEKEVKNQY